MNFSHQLATAASIDSVVALANQYLFQLPSEVVEAFPPHCRPEQIDDAAAIHHWRRQLLAEVSTLPGTPDLRFQELAVFFLRASSRVHAIASSSGETARAASTENAAA